MSATGFNFGNDWKLRPDVKLSMTLTKVDQAHIKTVVGDRELGNPLKNQESTTLVRTTKKSRKCRKIFKNTHNSEPNLRTHKEETPHVSPICSKSFAVKGYLVRHFKRLSEEKPYKCPYAHCEYYTAFKRDLERHFRVHRNEKPFKCTVCAKTFPNLSYRVRHMRTHTQEKPFHCKICARSFKRFETLTKHIRTHTKEEPFKCPLCAKRFFQTSSCVRHIRSHTQEKPFRCEICAKLFSRSDRLARHIRTHARKRPFKCLTCTKSFSRADSLNRHVRTHRKRMRSENGVRDRKEIVSVADPKRIQ